MGPPQHEQKIPCLPFLSQLQPQLPLKERPLFPFVSLVFGAFHWFPLFLLSQGY